MPLTRQRLSRRAAVVSALFATGLLVACDDDASTPNESNTYNVHLYYGKNVAQHKYLGQVVGISSCKTAVHTTAAEMGLKPHSYTYDCCWLNAGNICFQKHK